MAGVVDKLVPFVDSFSGFFHTYSDHNILPVQYYVKGLMQAKSQAKNIERIDEAVEGSTYQNLHHKISVSPWEARPLMDEIARQADGLLGGGTRTRLLIDDSGIAKKGTQSVGVARQYSGRAGKVDNCQIAVCGSLASGQHSLLCDIRLYLPTAWTDNPDRCQKAGIPEDQRHFRSKADLALEIVLHQRTLGIRFDVVSMDSGYGSQTPLLHDLDTAGETFVAEVHCDQLIHLEAPWPGDEPRRGSKPLQRPKPVLPGTRVDAWAAAQPESDWQRLKVRDTDQGWVEVNYLARRIWIMDGDEQKLWWLLAWENPDERRQASGGKTITGPRRHFALSNAAADIDERRLIADGVGRNAIERNFRDGKSEVGMADYQVRGWLGWQHHMALVMLALLFLTREKMHWSPPPGQEDHVPLTCGDLVFMLERLLPEKGRGPADPATCRRLLEKRLAQRQKDQDRRKRKTAQDRPPLLPDEIAPE